MGAGGGMAGDSFYNAASGTNHGPGSPQAHERTDAAARVEGEAGRARLWVALALLLVVIGLLVLL